MGGGKGEMEWVTSHPPLPPYYGEAKTQKGILVNNTAELKANTLEKYFPIISSMWHIYLWQQL